MRIVILLCLAVSVAGWIGCGGDPSTKSGQADDGGPDVNDDDIDDDTDDDNADDDVDDDTTDDDTWPPLPDDDTDDDTDDDVDDDADDDIDPYAALAPTGSLMDTRFGVSSHLSGGGPNDWREAELDTLADAGVVRIRRDFHWSVIEPADDSWNWSYTDTFRDIGRDRGFDFDALLAYGVDWAMPGGETSEIDPDDYADFAAHVAGRYCDDIHRYEIWNEENLSGRFWVPYADPDHYGAMLTAAYTAIHAACPDAEVLFGGMAPFNVLTGPYSFFTHVADAHPDICDSFDAMAIHPYSVAQHSAPEVGLMIGDIGYPDLLGHLADIRDRLAQAGCPDKTIHLTEFGWPSIFIGDALQADYLARAMILAAIDGADGLYWYTFWDGSGSASPITEDYFGLYSYDGGLPPDEQVPKPSYTAYAALTEVLAGTRPAGHIAAALGWPAGVYAAVFEADDNARVVVAVWDARVGAPDVERALPWPPGFDQATGIAEDGTHQGDLGTPDDGPITLTPTRAVQYIVFTHSTR